MTSAELARDCLQKDSLFSVVRGIISPVHDAYGKKVYTHHIANFIRQCLYVRMSVFFIKYLVSEQNTVLYYHSHSGSRGESSSCCNVPASSSKLRLDNVGHYLQQLHRMLYVWWLMFFIRVDHWETLQGGWTVTAQVLKHFQETVNADKSK